MPSETRQKNKTIKGEPLSPQSSKHSQRQSHRAQPPDMAEQNPPRTPSRHLHRSIGAFFALAAEWSLLRGYTQEQRQPASPH